MGTWTPGLGDTGADGVEFQDVADALLQGRSGGGGDKVAALAPAASSFAGNSACLLPAGSKKHQVPVSSSSSVSVQEKCFQR